MAKVLTYKSIIDAGGVIRSTVVNYNPDKCFVRTRIIDFSNVKFVGDTSLPAYKCINENELEILPKTLTSISTDSTQYIKGQGGSSKVKVTAKYNDNSTADVTSSCTFSITNASTTGVASWNTNNSAISHGAQGTATLNVSYTEGGVTKTTTASIRTDPAMPTNITATPASVTVSVNGTVTVTITGTLNNGNTVSGGSFNYIIQGNGSTYFSATKTTSGVTIKGKAKGSGQILVQYTTGQGSTIMIPVTVN